MSRLAHVACGILAGASLILLPNGGSAALCLTLTFIAYQLTERRAINDDAYPELLEYLLGMAYILTLAAAAIILLRVHSIPSP